MVAHGGHRRQGRDEEAGGAAGERRGRTADRRGDRRGRLGLRDPALVAGLIAMADSGLPPLQRHAAEALGRLATPKASPHLLPLLATRDEGVRRAAATAVGAFGDAALPALRARLATAQDDERRGVEEALARLGGKAALGTLLSAIDTSNIEEARAWPPRRRRRHAVGAQYDQGQRGGA